MDEPSYATARKLKIIESRLGADWRKNHPDVAVDAVYNRLVGDDRKTLFCKVQPGTKAKLDEMVTHYEIKMGEFIEKLIEVEYEIFIQQRTKMMQNLARDFSGE
jgi:hypothetical protein